MAKTDKIYFPINRKKNYLAFQKCKNYDPKIK